MSRTRRVANQPLTGGLRGVILAFGPARPGPANGFPWQETPNRDDQYTATTAW
jgi:hypothetical protein